MPTPDSRIAIGLSAAIVGIKAQSPLIVVIQEETNKDILPFGPFDPLQHRTFELGLRAFVSQQTGLDLGYVEQLYTFGDRGRHAKLHDQATHIVSVGYLALTHTTHPTRAPLKATLQPWYDYFPWEDWRQGRPPLLDNVLLPALHKWAKAPDPKPVNRKISRSERLKLAFALDGLIWDDERVLERYELLYEAGLVEETRADGRRVDRSNACIAQSGRPMQFDHRRILATAMSRLRAKIKYRPLVFELMPCEFTLTELQNTVEALAGRHIHKQNFRRLVESNALVEATGTTRATTGGRPAQLFRFRSNVIKEQPAPGLRI